LIFIAPSFLNEAECLHIKERAVAARMEKSFVMGGGMSYASSSSSSGPAAAVATDIGTEGSTASIKEMYRSSYNAWLSVDTVLASLQKRVAALTEIPLTYIQLKSEELQVVRYEAHGQFKVHHDSSAFHPRLLTALMYLNTVDDGGETWFPYATDMTETAPIEVPSTVEDAIKAALQKYESDGSSFGVKTKPLQGDALIFFNCDSTGRELDISAVHAGLPVLSSEKWVANYWIDNDLKTLNEHISMASNGP
jgi:prolyl 4-hydroxylase